MPSVPILIVLEGQNTGTAMRRTLKLQGISHIARQKASLKALGFARPLFLQILSSHSSAEKYFFCAAGNKTSSWAEQLSAKCCLPWERSWCPEMILLQKPRGLPPSSAVTNVTRVCHTMLSLPCRSIVVLWGRVCVSPCCLADHTEQICKIRGGVFETP